MNEINYKKVMLIKILNLHEHDIYYSFLTDTVNNLNFKYEIKGWFSLKKYESVKLKENDYINLYCNTCGYKYNSDKKIKALTIDFQHNLFFKENCLKVPYSRENTKIPVDKKYYSAEYFLVNTEHKDTMFVGYEKEIIECLFSEMKKYAIKNNNLLNGNPKNNNNKNNENEYEYDVVLNVDSIKNLASTGWEIKYKKKEGKKKYDEQYKNAETIVVGVVGNGNKGKSFLLQKLSNYDVPMGYNIKTEGLSIIYRKQESKNLTILDSAGQETPLLVQNKDNNNKDGFEFEEYSRDKLVTELYIQQFILWKSNIVILLVGSITLSEQKLYARVKSEILAIQENQKVNKKLFVVHNLQNFYHKKDVKDYIENVLKKLYNVELKEIQMFGLANRNRFDKYFLEKDNKNIIHLILINDYCNDSDYYNYNAIKYLKNAIANESDRQTFPILEDSKEFLLEISEQIMENKLSKGDVEIIQDKKADKLMVKNQKIQLKRFIVDEMGITKNDDNTLKYSYYVDPEKSKFIVSFELPGGGRIKPPTITVIQEYYSFRFEGEINGELSPKYDDYEKLKDEKYQELSKEKLDKIVFSKNLRKKHNIHIDFKVSNKDFHLNYNKDNRKPEYTKENTNKGIIFYIFDIILNPGKDDNEEISEF